MSKQSRNQQKLSQELLVLIAGLKTGDFTMVYGLAPDGMQEFLRLCLNGILLWGYCGWFGKHKGGTPGKLVLGLQVVDYRTGTRLGYGRMLYRETLGRLISAVSIVGFATVFFREDRRALHDFLAGSQVLRTRDR